MTCSCQAFRYAFVCKSAQRTAVLLQKDSKESCQWQQSALHAFCWQEIDCCCLCAQVTRERIRQIENKAMAKLKELDCDKKLRPFVNGEAMEYASDEVGWKANIRRGPGAHG